MEKPEYFILQPSVQLFGGVTVDKDTNFETENDDKTVKQTLKDLVLTTVLVRESEYQGIKIKEESKLTTEIPEGTVLIWSEETGYIIPQYKLVKVKEAIESLEKIEEITVPIEEKNTARILEFKAKE